MNGDHHPVGSPSGESGRVKIGYAELREKAEAATKGEWRLRNRSIEAVEKRGLSVAHAGAGTSVSADGAARIDAIEAIDNAAYIVAAQPSTVLALLDRIEELEGGRKQEVGIGMAIAAAIVMRCWGDDTYASEILGAAGYRTVADLRADGVEWYDIRALAPVLHGFREKDRARADRKALSGEKKP
jgi:hypothetical protein